MLTNKAIHNSDVTLAELSSTNGTFRKTLGGNEVVVTLLKVMECEK
jgi:hypothetical protein